MREYLKPYLSQDNITTTAKLQVFSTCHKFIETVPALIYDEHRVEDLDTHGEDHSADAIRYGLMSRPKANATIEEIRQKRFDMKMKKNKKKLNSGLRMTSY
jgi:hypothetical protein